jgi:class 3 adenylate cyclase/tetratricopeptide (TPR) repeat protein
MLDASLDIDSWLQQIGLAQYGPALRDNDIDLPLLLRLTDADLRDIGIASLGHRRRLLAAVAELAASPVQAAPFSPVAAFGLTPERRQLTVLFCDLVGSTALSTRLDPEDLRNLIRSYQQAASSHVSRFDGHLAQFLGDGVLAYFGWPRAHEDDAERAVRAGLAISRAVTALPSPDQDRLLARVGIATGLVVVGDLIGEGAGQQHAVTGETPNLAARLQGIAPPGAVVVSATTRQLVGDAFVLREMGALDLKGIAKPVVAYEVEGERTLESRFAAKHGDGVSPIVGRDEEMATLLTHWRTASDGSGQAVLLIGEAGIGKSRIAEALVEQAQRAGAHLLRYQCSPYHTDTPLHPVVQELAMAAGLSSEDAPAVKLDRLEHLLDPIGLLRDAPLIAALLDMEGSHRHGPMDVPPDEQRRRTLAALVERLATMAAQQPVLWLIEDAHWVDASTLELLTLALDRLASSRVLMLITARPEFTAPFAGHRAFALMHLSRLDPAAARNVVMQVTRGKELPASVLDEILSKADGLPLFAEEITRAVIESGGLRETAHGYQLEGSTRKLAIPASIRDSLLARLDRLEPLKALAQLAATIGREFRYSLLRALAPSDEPRLQRQLAGLVAAELIVPQGTPLELSYRFKHALIQDAAYESLLKSTRRHYHRRIAETMSGLFAPIAANQPEVLAYHYTQAGLHVEAIEQWKRAGSRSMSRTAYVEAVGHLTQALDLVRDLPVGRDRLACELDLLNECAPAIGATSGVSSPEVHAAYSRAWEICHELQYADATHLFPILMGLRRFHFVRGELGKAQSVAAELLPLTRESTDKAMTIETHLGFGVTAMWRGEFDEALLHLQKGADHFDAGEALTADPRNLMHVSDPLVNCLAVKSWALWATGAAKESLRRSMQSLDYARRLNHPISIALALDYAAALRIFRGEPAAALELAVEGSDLCEAHGLTFWRGLLNIRRGRALADLGQLDLGWKTLQEGFGIWQSTGAGLARPFLLAQMAEVQLRADCRESARRALQEAVEDMQGRDERFYESELMRQCGVVHLLAGEFDVAAQNLQRALDVACSQRARSWECRAAATAAYCQRTMNRPTEAYAILRRHRVSHAANKRELLALQRYGLKG